MQAASGGRVPLLRGRSAEAAVGQGGDAQGAVAGVCRQREGGWGEWTGVGPSWEAVTPQGWSPRGHAV